MLIKSEIPWHIVLIVFVAFISWVWNKFQEVAAERKRRRFQKEKRSYDQQEKQQQRQAQPSQKIPQSAKAAPAVASKSPLQQMMDAMTGNVEEIRRQQELAEAQRKAKLRAQQQRRATADNAPPPLPQRQKERVVVPQPAQARKKPTPAPAKDLGSLRAPTAPLKKSSLTRRKKRRSGVRSLLRGKDSLRQALIASEILQKPRGMDE